MTEEQKGTCSRFSGPQAAQQVPKRDLFALSGPTDAQQVPKRDLFTLFEPTGAQQAPKRDLFALSRAPDAKQVPKRDLFALSGLLNARDRIPFMRRSAIVALQLLLDLRSYLLALQIVAVILVADAELLLVRLPFP